MFYALVSEHETIVKIKREYGTEVLTNMQPTIINALLLMDCGTANLFIHLQLTQ